MVSPAPTTTTTTRPRAGAKQSAKRARVDAALRAALSLHGDSDDRWSALIRDGADDNQIWQALKREFGTGGSSQTESGVQYAYEGGDGFSAPPRFWVDAGSHYTQQKATLSGAALVKRVREVLSIPEPSPESASGDDEAVMGREMRELRETYHSLPDDLTREGWELGSEGEKFYAQVERDGKVAGMTILHRTVSEVIGEARRLQERIPPLADPASPKASSGDGKREFVEPTVTQIDAAALLEVTEREQRARWEALQQAEETLTTKHSKSKQKELQKAHDDLLALYVRTWGELSDATSPQVANDLRNRIEGREGSTSAAPDDEVLPPREVFYTVTQKGEVAGGEFYVALCYTPDDAELDDDGEALIAVAEGGAKRVVARRGLDKSDEEILKAVADHKDLIPPHEYEQDGKKNWCKLCLFDRAHPLHPPTEEQLIGMLELVSIEASVETVQGWTPEQRRLAENYAVVGHIAVNDHDDIVVPPLPDFLRSSTVAAGDVVEDTPATDAAHAEPRVFKREIEVALNDHDIASKARVLSAKRVQIEELQSEKKRTDDHYKEKIGGLEAECAELLRAIRNGHDTLELDVYERRDYERKVVELVRVDSGETVETRAMKPTELQQPLLAV